MQFPSGHSTVFAIVDNVDALAWVANLGCIELHTWHSRVPEIERPDYLLIDLDPTTRRPVAVRARDRARRARGDGRARAALVPEDVGRDRACTSSRRSSPSSLFPDVRRFAKALAVEVERRIDDQAVATTTWRVADRVGVFVDFGQNARDRTIASAYSVRPTPDARVSAPLRWDEVADVEPGGVHARDDGGAHRSGRRPDARDVAQPAVAAQPVREARPRASIGFVTRPNTALKSAPYRGVDAAPRPARGSRRAPRAPGGRRTRRRTSATACRTTRGSSTGPGTLDEPARPARRARRRRRARDGRLARDRAASRRVRLVARRPAARRAALARDRAARDAVRHARLGERRPAARTGRRRVEHDASPRSRATSRERYPFVHLWAIWNEPNQRRWLRPTSPRDVRRSSCSTRRTPRSMRSSPSSQVAGGVTAPRGSTGGVSPVAWIAGMAAAHARLDAYAHNPYPLSPRRDADERRLRPLRRRSRWRRCRACSRDVQRAFGARTRIWLTEYGYQTNPPDQLLGVSYATQAQYVERGRAARVRRAARRRAHPLPRRGRAGSGALAERRVHGRRTARSRRCRRSAFPFAAAVADGHADDAVGSDPSRAASRRTGCSGRSGHGGFASAPTGGRPRAAT